MKIKTLRKLIKGLKPTDDFAHVEYPQIPADTGFYVYRKGKVIRKRKSVMTIN